jgi:hypothetical protein
MENFFPKVTSRNAFGQLVDDIKDVEVRRGSQELSSALPGASVTRIEDPVSLLCEEGGQGLFARNGGHAVAEDDDFLLLAGAGRGQEFGEDFFLETGAEHDGGGGL